MPNEPRETHTVFSPLMPDLEAVLQRRISSRLIIDEYSKFGMDVERFFVGVESVGIYECPQTKYRFYHPPSTMGDDVFYEEMQRIGIDYYVKEKGEFEIALRGIREGERVLEVGCGDGVFLEKLRQKNIEGVGLEFNKLAVAKCLSKGLDVRGGSIEDFASAHPEEFDVVVLFQVLEHIYDVRAFIQDLLRCLKKGGKLIVAVPDNSPYYQNFRIHLTFNMPPHHIGLWNDESFRNLAKVFDLSLVSIDYDEAHGSLPKYVYFLGDLLLSRFPLIHENILVRNLLIGFLLPYTLPVVLKMKLRGELRPQTIIATFAKP